MKILRIWELSKFLVISTPYMHASASCVVHVHYREPGAQQIMDLVKTLSNQYNGEEKVYLF